MKTFDPFLFCGSDHVGVADRWMEEIKIDTCHKCKHFTWPTEYRFYGHCLMNGHYFLPDYMACERFESNEKSGRTAKVKHQESTHGYQMGRCGNCENRVDSYMNYCLSCGCRLEWE